VTRSGASLAAIAILVVAAMAATALPSRAGADELPPASQALLLLRILAYDRTLPGRSGGGVVVAVAARRGDQAGEERRDQLVEALREAASTFGVAGQAVRVVGIGWQPERAGERLRAEQVTALVVVGALEQEAAQVAAVTRASRVLSATTSREAVAAGLSVGLVHRGRKAGILVNLAAARAEGVDFHSDLLAVAEVLPGR
jgi:hypothetical protein